MGSSIVTPPWTNCMKLVSCFRSSLSTKQLKTCLILSIFNKNMELDWTGPFHTLSTESKRVATACMYSQSSFSCLALPLSPLTKRTADPSTNQERYVDASQAALTVCLKSECDLCVQRET
jgi:hypothetical protein